MSNLCKFIVVLITTSGSFVQAEDKKPQADPAVQAFAEGQALFEKGAHLEAAAAFNRAYQLRPHPLVLGNLGHCYDAAGDYPRAVETFRKYLEQPSPDDPAFSKNISKRLKVLQRKVGDLRISCRSIRCSVTVDGLAQGLAPVALVVMAGVHQVKVEAVDGPLNRHYEANVRGGAEHVLDVDFADASTSARPEVSPPSTVALEDKRDKPNGLRAAFWTTTSATVVGLGAIAILGALNVDNQDEFQQSGSEDAQLQKRGEALNLATNIAIGLTCATATTTLILGVIALKRRSNLKKEPQKTALLPVVSATPLLGPFVGISIRFP
jgi:tetratricopeptide (TPR) repeat protein